jgi:hypothetical protein
VDVCRRIETDLIEELPDLDMKAYFATRTAWLSGADYIVIAQTAGRTVGLLTAEWWTVPDAPPFLRLETFFIGVAHRGKRLTPTMIAGLLWLVRSDRGDMPTWTVLKTCNPLAFAAMATFEKLDGFLFYPRVDGAEQDPLMREMATRVARHLNPGCRFRSDRGVIEACSHPPNLYAALPGGGPDAVRSYLHRELGVNDRVLCLGMIGTEEAKQAIIDRLGIETRAAARTTSSRAVP